MSKETKKTVQPATTTPATTTPAPAPATTKTDERKAAELKKRDELKALVNKLGYSTRATENDETKKKRFYVVAKYDETEKSICWVTYSVKGENVRINTGKEYKGSEFHKGWSGPYSSIVAPAELKAILIELKNAYKPAKKAPAEKKKGDEKK